MAEEIPVVDLFAGPGGLGEGFSAHAGRAKVVLSAEADAWAHQTLRWRAFHRILETNGTPDSLYLDYLNGERPHPPIDASPYLARAWAEAGIEALNLTIGTDAGDALLRRRIRELKLRNNPWVLIGGPPCQAYSIVGRVRNRGNLDYVAHEDTRHFLYREYLKIIQEFRPAVFVMENVQGILSSSVRGQKIFHQILSDLADPDIAVGHSRSKGGYRIRSITEPDAVFRSGMDPDEFDSNAFTVCAANHGVPQLRHRVFLVGIREDLDIELGALKIDDHPEVTVDAALDGLPKIRSRLSREPDGAREWRQAVLSEGRRLLKDSKRQGHDRLSGEIATALAEIGDLELGTGGIRIPFKGRKSPGNSAAVMAYVKWCNDPKLGVALNHEARAHMRSDLGRYLFAACFALAEGRTPKGPADFSLPGLRPDHRNWETGNFDDRFRVQVRGQPACTVTSHIAKDGHYFIHPDASQCRSMTVREAARVQTFPDNYLFVGPRTAQYKQVGNAVPPLLAHKIAKLILDGLHEMKPDSPRAGKNREQGQMGLLDELTVV